MYKSIFFTMPKDELEKLVKESNNYSQIFDKLGMCKKDLQYKRLQKRINEEKISVSHFKKYSPPAQKRTPLKDVFCENSKYKGNIREVVLRENIIPYVCEKCNNDGNWLNEKLTLQLDHKNGMRTDNRIENVRWLCPNCHSQTETFSGRNTKGIFKVEYHCDCGESIQKGSKHCVDCSHKILEKIKWPSYGELIKMIDESNFVQTAKKLGVSDNTIRKRLKKLEHHVGTGPT